MQSAIDIKGGAPRWLRDSIAEAMLAFINDAGEPVGARQIRAGLAESGHDLSESTMARRLRDLDAHGFTRQVGSKGRVVTAQGAESVARIRRNSRGARLIAATDIRDADDLLNLLKARRAVEPEAVRDAAAHTTSDDLDDLRGLLETHRRQLQQGEPVQPLLSMEFHRRVAEPAMNPLVRAMHRLVLDTNLEHVDTTLDVILSAHHHSESSVTAHQQIIEAIARKDDVQAGELMREHVTNLLEETQQFIEAHGSDLVSHLLLGHGHKGQ
ncbi:FCD domain-containing protein [Streptomyces sp. NPDC052043]|uniref:FadR/GntR family transcriptional regulator n=1 Tax=Streptomyces sp. NPDC052043 TaxID=3365684 RepID=UPI0037D2BDB9